MSKGDFTRGNGGANSSDPAGDFGGEPNTNFSTQKGDGLEELELMKVPSGIPLKEENPGEVSHGLPNHGWKGISGRRG